MKRLRTLQKENRSTRAAAMPAVYAGRYLVECAVAGDAAWIVWRAKELSGDATVALKLFATELVSDPAVLASGLQIIRDVQCIDHPFVVSPKELLPGGSRSALVTPWIDGPSLRRMASARPRQAFEVDDFRRWLRALLDAVAAAHARGVVHGAITPDVVLQQAGELRVIGWGTDAWLNRAYRQGARPDPREPAFPYMSPAQRRGEPPAPSDDIFALGVLCYEMLTGSLPVRAWWGGPPRLLQRQRRSRGIRGAVPVNWERAIRQCLLPNPAERPASIQGLRLFLELGAPSPIAPRSFPAREREVAVSGPASAPRAAASGSAPPKAAAAVAREARAAVIEQPGRSERRPVGTQPRPPLRGAAAFSPKSQPPSVGPVSEALIHDPGVSDAARGEPVPGVLALRCLLAVVALATVGVGGLLAWQVAHREAPRGDAVVHPDGTSGAVFRPAPRIDDVADDKSVAQRPETPQEAPAPPWHLPTETAAEAGRSVRDVSIREMSAKESGGRLLEQSVVEAGEADVLARADGESIPAAAPGRMLRLPDEMTPVRAAGSPLSGGILEIDEVEVLPRLIERIEPELPPNVGRGVGPERVELVVVIDRMGRVASASVHSTTEEALVAPTLKAARLWRFTPATRNGRAVAVRVAIPLVYQAR